MERKYVKSVGIMQGGKKSGVCRDWIELDNITPEDQNIFDYLKVKCNQRNVHSSISFYVMNHNHQGSTRLFNRPTYNLYL